MRPGRLDRILFVGPPDQTGREEILRIRMNSMSVGPDVDIPGLAQLVSRSCPSNAPGYDSHRHSDRRTAVLVLKFHLCVRRLQ